MGAPGATRHKAKRGEDDRRDATPPNDFFHGNPSSVFIIFYGTTARQ
jgi:hypothetical protein